MGQLRTEKCIALESIELTLAISKHIKDESYGKVMSLIFEKLKELNHGKEKSE